LWDWLLSERSFENFDDPLLPTGPAGDVVAARVLARELIGSAMGSCPDMVDPVLATLVLSAACLHTAAVVGDVRRTDLVRFLISIMDDGGPGPALFHSPMQFVRYAALELQSLPSRRRECLLLILIRTLGADHAVDDQACEELDNKSRQVRF
jgi:hypothetical protein